MAANYNLHNLLSVDISSHHRSIQEGYEHYFRFFQTDKTPTLGAQYKVVDFSEFQLPRRYQQAGAQICFSGGFLLPKEKYAVVVKENGLTEYTTYANRATNLWLQTLLVPQAVSLVHGAGVSFLNKGVLFAGFGGVGKTLLIAELKKRSDFKFFGDDYVMINSQGLMYAYPTDFSIYPYHRVVFPELEKTRFASYLTRRKILYPYYEFERAVNFVVRRWGVSGQPFFTAWNAPYIKVPARIFLPTDKIGQSQFLSSCVLLTRHNGPVSLLEELKEADLVAALIGNLLIEFTIGLPYLYLLSALNCFSLVDFFNSQLSVIHQGLGSLKKFRLSIPLSIDTHAVASTIIDYLPQIL